MAQEYEDISAVRLREYMAGRREKDYLLVDVRQPDEYAKGHIPGSVLIPLGELSSRMRELPGDSDIVFYCRSGKRSRAAALFAGSHPTLSGRKYNMEGGMLAWDGHTLSATPNIRAFKLTGSDQELLLQSMDLERGAERFYAVLGERYPGPPWEKPLATLAGAEEQHAKMIYRFWAAGMEAPPTFEIVYASLKGDIVEGGTSFADLMTELDRHSATAPCRDIMELALSIEYAAYDLSRNMAHHFHDQAIAAAFTTIAEAEKEHMRLVAQIMAQCVT